MSKDMNNQGLLVIPGAQKSGTVSLYRMLLQHDSIHALNRVSGGRGKEHHFFSLKNSLVRSKIDWYESLIGKKSGWYVDGSTSYFMNPNAAHLIGELDLPVKFLFLLREPAERALSSCLHLKRHNPPPDRRTFREIVDFIWKHKDEGIAKAENESIRRAIRQGKIDPNYLRSYIESLPVPSSDKDLENCFEDHLWNYKYFQYSVYSKWIKHYKGSNHDIMIVSMKEMIDSTKKVAEDIFDYIEVENQKVELTHANKTIYVSRPIRKTMEYIKKRTPIEGTGIWRRVRKMLPSSVVRNTHQAKEKNQESLKRGRVLLESEYQYWSKNKPSVLDK